MNLAGLLSIIERAPSVARLRDSLGAPNVRLTVGVNDAAKPAAIAAVARDWPGPVLVVTSRSDRAEALAEEVGVWIGEPERILIFPERDALPYERLVPARDIVRDRLQAVAALAGHNRPIIVAAGLALAQRTISPVQARESARRLRMGDHLDIDTFLASLVSLGYTVEPLVQEAGEASRRGGIIDVFPPTALAPVRIELFGRQIESLRLFDPATQRSVQNVEEAELGPARELLAGDASALEALDFGRCSDGVREQFEEEITLLRDALSFKDEGFYVPFLTPSTLLDHVPAGALVIVDEEPDVGAEIEEAQAQAESVRSDMEERGEIPRGLPSPLEGWPRLLSAVESFPGTTAVLRFSRWASEESAVVLRLPFSGATAYGGQLRKLVSETVAETHRGGRAVVVSQQAQRLAELFAEEDVPTAVSETVGREPAHLTLMQGSLAEGWALADGDVQLTLTTDTEVFGFTKQRRAPPRKAINREAFLAELTVGGYVVHIDHGIARFAGLMRRSVDGHEREYLELHYAEGDKLFVPTEQLDRVSRYIGPSDREPRVTRLASGDWQRAKQRVRRAVQALAKDLLALYAAREALPGYAYAADTPWQMELEASFAFVETADQLAAIAAVKRDMEAARPMDRLVCGDVGYGKTEVAVRAAFKAVMEGRQVAILVPTTVLAQQHFQTFGERLAAFPARVEMLSRFRSDAEQRQIVEELAAGTVDIVIGTHRLLQKDVSFKNLGLAVIDEEQRFGVAHKEHLKRMRKEVDVLTLSATPIPRTLYMAMGGIRDMSTMETPPELRLPIKTYVSEFDERLVRETIVREIERGGQTYFVHNRVHNIDMIAGKVMEIVPEARVGVGHGQMDEKELARTMREFVEGRTDVLVCTTIIESGLDIPNVNTIIINQADKLGLGQMYQLRGRVGRGAHRAYAYLFYDRKARLTDTARQRLQTIFEATELGAGFQIALRDLEIRGAGNLLGAEQSGFMAAVGFDLYIKLLSGAVERMRSLMRGEAPAPEREGPEITIDLPLSAHLPSSYVPDLNLRLALYQRLSAATDLEEVSMIAQEMVDRFGEPPPLARNLLYVVSLRTVGMQAGVQSMTTEDGGCAVRLREGEMLPRAALEAVVAKGVQVGHSLLRIELGEGWRERLRETVERLAAFRAEETPVSSA
jgi:transcription-repair coupling factor (superfamily II helicase)